jgi:catechol 2,3-dioxygenase-like lactoylglutathione lyase family enzyme
MRRFHVHVSVDELEANIRFYSSVFGQEPTVRKDDYAKWMVDDPRINFAVSKRGHQAGVNHLGIQVDSDEELAELRSRVASADVALLDQTNASCCYTKSNKYWVTDPQGVAWETYRTLDSIPTFGEDTRAKTEVVAGATSVPAPRKLDQSAVKPQANACCG